jgi:two-component system chemotaxis response regulator CheB
MGASAGGVEALLDVLGSLPSDLGAAVLIVLHLGPGASGRLADVLNRRATLPVTTAEDRLRMRSGHVYVAPPDHHLLVLDGHLGVTQGPRENFHRPSIDALFRSIAEVQGHRGVGVLLSGTRTDGVAGLAAIRAHGGSTVVQSPADALFPDLPQHAISMDVADQVAPAAAIGALLVERLAAIELPQPTPAGEEGPVESKLVTVHGSTGSTPPGRPATFGCPECGGSLWQLEDGDVLRFRCRIGHGYSADDLLMGQRDAVEAAFWTAIRALEEHADLNATLAARSEARGNHRASESYADRARDSRRKSALLRDTIGKAIPPPADVEGASA